MELPGTLEPLLAEVSATPARFQFQAVVRVVIHVRGKHFVVLEYADDGARVHESDAESKVGGDRVGLVVVDDFSAIGELGARWCSYWRDRSVHWIVIHDVREAAMKSRVSRFLETAAARIADGQAVDWAAAEVNGPLSARDRSLVDVMRSVETIADVHRAASSEDGDMKRVAFSDLSRRREL